MIGPASASPFEARDGGDVEGGRGGGVGRLGIGPKIGRAGGLLPARLRPFRSAAGAPPPPPPPPAPVPLGGGGAAAPADGRQRRRVQPRPGSAWPAPAPPWWSTSAR